MTTYESVTIKRTKSGRCPVCDKRATRTRNFEQTINPFHSALKSLPPNATHADARAAVRASVTAEADAWAPDFQHAACEAVDHE